jgi:hypothetical protein
VRSLVCTVALVVLAACGGAGGGEDGGGGQGGSGGGAAAPPDLVPAIGYVKASNTGANDFFGVSVALSADGNTLAVGAFFEDSSSGAVYVYSRSGGAWSQQVYVKASNAGVGDLFGISVALSADGNTLAVGAYWEDSGTTGVNSTPNEAAADSGAVYVFIRSGGVWSQQAYVKASNTGAGDFFGVSVALSADGDTLAVGAVHEDSGTTGVNSTPNEVASNSGAVYVFSRSGGAWTQQAYVKASNAGVGDLFGISVALSADGNTLAVGAYFEDSGTTGVNSTPNEAAEDAGAVYVFSRSGGVWSQQAYVKASNTGVDDFFGVSVALSADGNTLAVGADLEDSGTTGVDSMPDEAAPSSGAVYVFSRSGGVWSQQAYLKASNTGPADIFGISVALSADGNTLAVGATHEDSGTTGVNSTPDEAAADSGAVYVFSRSGGVWSQRSYLKSSNTGADDQFGRSVALSADGNTLAVGANGEDSGTTGMNSTPNEAAADSGAVYLY